MSNLKHSFGFKALVFLGLCAILVMATDQTGIGPGGEKPPPGNLIHLRLTRTRDHLVQWVRRHTATRLQQASPGAGGSADGSEAPTMVGGRPSEEFHYAVNIPLTKVQAVTYTTVKVGTPPTEFNVVLDTGSATLLVPATDCAQCASKRSYSRLRSSTSTVVRGNDWRCASPTGGDSCPLSRRYVDRTELTGRLMEDVVGLGPVNATSTFAEMLTESPPGRLSALEIDGILGFGYKVLNDGVNTVWDDLRETHKLDDIFSIYVGSVGSQNDGVLTLGGMDPTQWLAPPVYTPIVAETYYIVSAMAMWLGKEGVSPVVGMFGCVVDTGTTVLSLAPPLFDTFRSYLQLSFCRYPSNHDRHVVAAVCSSKGSLWDGMCYNKLPIQQFPDISFQFEGGALVVLQPEDYFVAVAHDGMVFQCLGVDRSGDRLTILGDVFLSRLYVIFDRKNKRIGFASHPRGVSGPIGLDDLSGKSLGELFGMWWNSQQMSLTFVLLCLGILMLLAFLFSALCRCCCPSRADDPAASPIIVSPGGPGHPHYHTGTFA